MSDKVLTCLHCGNKTSMKIVASHNLTDHEEIWDYSVDYYHPAYVLSFYKKWDMFLCPVCNEVTIEKVTHFSEETEPNGKPIYNAKIIYPTHSTNSSGIRPRSSKKLEVGSMRISVLRKLEQPDTSAPPNRIAAATSFLKVVRRREYKNVI